MGAKAFFILGIEEVAYVYALDGSLVNIEGYSYEGNHFTESSCRDLAVTGFGACFQAQATECDEIRDWE